MLVIEDLPDGPLNQYRKQASFDWKQMKLVFEDDVEYYNIKMTMWKTLYEDPLFAKSKKSLNSDDMQKIAAKRIHRYLQLNFFPPNMLSLPYTKRLRIMMAANEGLSMAFPDVAVKHGIGVGVVNNMLSTLGTERHKHFLDAVWDGKVVGCVALTEMAHGSNTKQMKTTATFDKTTQQFVLHTPDFEAAKCWCGNLGKTSTLAIVFAQLITNGQNFGLHAFVVPIRDPKTLLPYPGVVIGDMGEKIGLHGIDNGFMMFENFRIPRDNLLNRTADVTPEGEYESSFLEPGKILGAVLESLSLARVGILQGSVNAIIQAITIAVRYGSVRRQFSENGSDIEFPIIEYQLHQWRLFPYVATAAVLKIFIQSFTKDYLEALEESNRSDRLEDINNLVSEIHSIVSGAKPLITWTARDIIQECREACGGHGYLKASGFGYLKDHNDATVTYEGDNNVLQQQSSNWLLKQWNNLKEHKQINSPLSTAHFFENYSQISQKKFNKTDDIRSLKYIMECYEWLIIYLVQDISSLLSQLQKEGYSRFALKNLTQVYRCNEMSKAYAELNVLRYFWKELKSLPENLSSPLNHLGVLYGLFCLDRHISYFYQGGFSESPHLARNVKKAILDLCEEVKPNIISMVDSLAPPNPIVNSVLGNSDGKIYEHLERCLFDADGCFDRPDWWAEVIIPDSPDFYNMKSKL